MQKQGSKVATRKGPTSRENTKNAGHEHVEMFGISSAKHHEKC